MKVENLFMAGLCLALLVSGALPAPAQGLYGLLRGEVRDGTGATIAAAAVSIKNQETGETRSQQTTTSGTFNFAQLAPGRYTLTVQATGFAGYTRADVEVRTNQAVDLIANLEVGQVKEVVTVEAGADMVQTSSAQLVGATFSREVHELPNFGLEGGRATGSPLNLALLAPGTTSQPGGVVGAGGSIGGNRPRQNNFVVDGLDNNLPSVTGPVSTVIQDSVAEFTLLTNMFTAEFGHSTAGQFITVTKSGTNNLHGGGWWYGQNRDFNSLDNITRSVTAPGDDKPRFDWNRLGGQAGGPLRKDRLFYYGAFEYRNLSLAGSPSGQILVPTSAGLSTLKALASDASTGISPTNVGILADHVPVAGAAASTTSVLNERTGGQVPIELGTFSATTPNFDREHVFLLSGDYITNRHRLSGRFNYSRERFLASGELPVPAFNSNSLYDTRRVTVSDVFTVTPRVVNELRAAYLRASADSPVALPKAPGSTDIFANYGINDLSLGIGPQSNFPQGQGNNVYELVDHVSWVHGAHTIKAGVEGRDIIAWSGFLPRARGEYTWTTLDTFVRDTFPTAVSIRGVGLSNFSQNRAGLFSFVQDTWKLSRRLTLELGLRYEYTQTARDSKLQDLNGISSIPSFRAHPAFAELPPAHQKALIEHLGEGIIFRRPQADNNNWAPRIGLAWDVFGDGRTSVRAGFAVAHDVMFGNLPLLGLPPQVQAESRETNACSVSPAPAWCKYVPTGGNAQNATDIRFSNIGFIEGGAIFPTLPGAALVDPDAARAFTQAYIQDEQVPETYTWSAAVQHRFRENWMVEGRYVGNHAIKLPVQRWASAGVPLSNRLPVFTNEQDALSKNFNGAYTRGDVLNEQNLLLLPFGFGGVVTMFGPDGQSWYHGGSLAVEKRMSRGLLLHTNYTFSKTIDMVENELNTSFMNPRRPMNHLNLRENKGLSGLHRAQKFTVSWLWEIPSYKGSSVFLRKALGGWQYNASYIAETGQPVTVISRRDANGDVDTAGDTAIYNPAGTGNRGSDVNYVCWNGTASSVATSVAKCGGSARVVGYVAKDPTARYIRAELGARTNLGRNTFLSPGMNIWNMALVKNTALWNESARLQFRLEVANPFNHPNFILGAGSAFPTTANSLGFPGYVTPGSSQFLDKTIFSGGLGQAPFQRVVQFGVKLLF